MGGKCGNEGIKDLVLKELHPGQVRQTGGPRLKGMPKSSHADSRVPRKQSDQQLHLKTRCTDKVTA